MYRFDAGEDPGKRMEGEEGRRVLVSSAIEVPFQTASFGPCGLSHNGESSRGPGAQEDARVLASGMRGTHTAGGTYPHTRRYIQTKNTYRPTASRLSVHRGQGPPSAKAMGGRCHAESNGGEGRGGAAHNVTDVHLCAAEGVGVGRGGPEEVREAGPRPTGPRQRRGAAAG